MPGKFILRSEGDATNPFAARLYGKGITAGRTVFYNNTPTSGSTSRTTFLAVLTQGARYSGDLGCKGPLKVYYAGFELSEFGTGGFRQWKYHPGTISKAPNYKQVVSVNQVDNTFEVTGHGYATGDFVAFHGRGADVALPTAAAGVIGFHVKWMVWVVDANHFKVLRLGAPVEADAFDLNSAGANLNRLFVYKADAFYFDPVQGRPEFFSNVNHTFSGFSYIEVWLPEHLSDGEDEPANLKVVMEGKEVYQIINTGGSVAFDLANKTAIPNNALVAVDALYGDAKLPLSRLNGPTFVDWKTRCDELIPWNGGNSIPAPRASWASLVNATFNATTNRLTHAGGAGSGYAFTEAFSDAAASLEAKYPGGSMTLAFSLDATVGANTQQGVYINNGTMNYYAPGGALSEIVGIHAGDVVKIAYENTVLRIYLNGIQMPLVNVSQAQAYTTYRAKIVLLTSGMNVDSIFVAPSGTNALPRQVPRFRGGFTAIEPTAVADLFDTMVHLAPGTSWADIDGQVTIASIPDRTPVYTFSVDPAGVTNVAKITPKRRKPDAGYNFYSFTFRDDDSPILARGYETINRKERRAEAGGRLVNAGLRQYGVISRSQMQRLGETRAVIETDLDIGFTVEAFLDSIPVVKGSFVNVAAPEAGYTTADPALCIVNEIRQSFGADVETLTYELQIITPDFYRDDAHGQVVPGFGTGVSTHFTPPPPLLDLDVFESTDPVPGGGYVSTISGNATFNTFVNQHARIFTKSLTTKLGDVTFNSGTNVFTLTSGAMPVGTDELAIGSLVNNTPGGLLQDFPYYPVNIVGNTFKLSRDLSGAPDVFTSNGASLALYRYAAWYDTGVDVYPDAVSNQAAFEVGPAYIGLTYVRAATRSQGNASINFNVQRTEVLEITGHAVPPEPPLNIRTYYNGINITWEFDASPSIGVTSYKVTDEFDRIIAIVQQPIFIEAATTDTITRRFYAVTSVGVVSTTYATATFIKPFRFRWGVLRETTENPDFTLTVSSTASLYRGGTLGTVILPQGASARVYFAPHSIANQGLVLTPNRIWFPTLFYSGVYFNDDGTYGPFPGNSTYGNYAAGDMFAFDVAAGRLLKRELQSNGQVLETIIASGLAWGGTSHLYVRAFTDDGIGSVIDLRPTIVGNLADGIEIAPGPAQNLVNATSTVDSITRTAGAGWGSSGGSFAGIRANQAGAFYFFAPGGSGLNGSGVAVGLSVTDPDTNVTSMPFHVRCEADGSLSVYNNGVLLFNEPTPAQQGSFPMLGGIEQICLGRTLSGAPYVSVDDHLIYTYAGASASLKNDPLVLDVAFNGSTGAVWTVGGVALVRPYTDELTPDAAVLSMTVALEENAYAGNNRVYDIPSFDLSTPLAGSVLFVNSSNQVAQDNTRFLFDEATDTLKLGDTSYLGNAVGSSAVAGWRDSKAWLKIGFDTPYVENVAPVYAAQLDMHRSVTAGAGHQTTGLRPRAWIENYSASAYGIIATAMEAFVENTNSTIATCLQAVEGITQSSGPALWTVGGWFQTTGVGSTAFADWGVRSLVARSAGTSPTAVAYETILNTSGAGVITDGFGVRMAGWSGGGIVNSYGLYMDASIDRGTTSRWAIYSTATSQSRLSGRLNIRVTSEQQRWEYDASNYANITVGSTGNTTFDATGSGARFTFNDAVAIPVSQGSVLFGGASGVISEDNNTLYWDNTYKRLLLGTPVFSAPGTLLSTNLQINRPAVFTPVGSVGVRVVEVYAYINGATNNPNCIAGLFDASYSGSGTNANILGLQMSAAHQGSATALQVLGGQFAVNSASSAGATTAAGVTGSASSTATGTVTTAYGGKFSTTAGNGSSITTANIVSAELSMGATGTVTTLKGVNIAGWSASGTVTNSYGLYMDTSIDRGTTERWAIYSTATAQSRLSGRLNIRVTTEQQRWEYDGSNYVSFTVNASGNVIISPASTAKIINFEGIIAARADSGSGEVRSYQSPTSPFISLKTDSGKSGIFRSNTNFFVYYDTGTGDTVLDATFAGSVVDFRIQGTSKARIHSDGSFRGIYDGSNYYSATVGATGTVTFDAVGSAAKFVFSDKVEAPIANQYAAGWLTSPEVPTKDNFYRAVQHRLVSDAWANDSTIGDTTTIFTLEAGHFYAVEGFLNYVKMGSLGNLTLDFDGGTATLLNFEVEIREYDDTTGVQQSWQLHTSKATDFTTALATGLIQIKGYLRCNAAGTLILRGAQSFAEIADTYADGWIKLTKVV